LDEGEWKVEWKTDDLYTIILKYIIHFILLNWKYVHNVFTILLPNFQSLFKVSLLFFSTWPVSLLKEKSKFCLKLIELLLFFRIFLKCLRHLSSTKAQSLFISALLGCHFVAKDWNFSETEKISSWNGPNVHVCCFMLARASTKTFVSRIYIR
jgi:hypothetical protein